MKALWYIIIIVIASMIFSMYALSEYSKPTNNYENKEWLDNEHGVVARYIHEKNDPTYNSDHRIQRQSFSDRGEYTIEIIKYTGMDYPLIFITNKTGYNIDFDAIYDKTVETYGDRYENTHPTDVNLESYIAKWKNFTAYERLHPEIKEKFYHDTQYKAYELGPYEGSIIVP